MTLQLGRPRRGRRHRRADPAGRRPRVLRGRGERRNGRGAEPAPRARPSAVQGCALCGTRWQGGPRASCRPASSRSCATRARCPRPSWPTRSRSRGPRSAPRSAGSVELGLAVEAGPAASRGGRRSTLVDLSAGHPLRRASRIGATGLSVGVTDGRLTCSPLGTAPCDIRQGPEAVLAAGARDVARGAGRGRASTALSGRRRRRARARSTSTAGVPVSPPIMPGWDGYPVRDALSRELGCPVVLDNDVNVMALGEQHAGVARSARTSSS